MSVRGLLCCMCWHAALGVRTDTMKWRASGEPACRNLFPGHCRTVDELFCRPARSPCSNYDIVEHGAQLDGRRVHPDKLAAHLPDILRLLAIHLQDNDERVRADGWCLASQGLLSEMHAAGRLHLHGFRQCTLRNGNAMSSGIDKSQPRSDNAWALVAFNEGPVAGNMYFCVAQVVAYVRAAAGSGIFAGFDPAECNSAGVQFAAEAAVHRPLRLALCKLWLAQGGTAAMGAVGCRETMHPVTMQPPDLVVVSNMAEAMPLLKGPGHTVFKQRHNRRFYGLYLVDINELMCQLAPTNSGPRRRCFLVCNKLSGK